MAYPAGIQALTLKYDGPDQPIMAAHMNALKTALDEFRAVIGDAPQGTVQNLQSRLAVALTTAGKIKSQTAFKIVGKSGVEYNTIQSAINAATAGDTVLVLPGTYTEAVTMRDNIDVVGLGMIPSTVGWNEFYSRVVIQAPANQSAITCANSTLSNVTVGGDPSQPAIKATNKPIRLTAVAAVSGGGVIIKHSGSFEIQASFCRFSTVCQHVLSVSGSTHFFEYCVLDTGEEHDLIEWINPANLYFLFCRLSSGNGEIVVPSGAVFYARLCSIAGAVVGPGTKDMGTMVGANTSSWYGGMF